jgi:hypothetical protein
MGVMGWKAALAAVVLAVLVPVGSGPPAGAAGEPRRLPDSGWVYNAYGDLLDRDPTAAQLAHRVSQLEAGVAHRAIADQLVGSRERALLIVDELFRRVLDRPADPDARVYWADRLTSGTKESTFASFVYGSPELYARAGGTPEAYVALLYRDVLGREPDPDGAAYWTARVAAGENRTGLARSWYLSAEATGLRAGLHFLHLLDRPPTPAERADWGARLQRHDRRRIEAALVSSEWYGDRRGTVLTAGDGPSREPSISADGRMVAFTSAANDLTPAGSPPFDDVFVFDRRTGRLRAITAGNGHSSAPEVSADGSTVVFQSAATNLGPGDDDGNVDVFRAPTAGGPIERLSAGDGDSTAPTVSGDGSVVAYSRIGEVDVRTGAPGEQPAVEQVDGYAPVLAADGGTIVFRAGDHAYLARLPLGPAPEPVQLDEFAATSTVTVSADGSRAVYLELEPTDGTSIVVPPRLVLAVVDETGVVSRIDGKAQDYSLKHPRIVDDGGQVLIEVDAEFTGPVDVAFAVPDGTPRAAPNFPVGSEPSGDGSLVVGTYQHEIVLYDGRIGADIWW